MMYCLSLYVRNKVRRTMISCMSVTSVVIRRMILPRFRSGELFALCSLVFYRTALHIVGWQPQYYYNYTTWYLVQYTSAVPSTLYEPHAVVNDNDKTYNHHDKTTKRQKNGFVGQYLAEHNVADRNGGSFLAHPATNYSCATATSACCGCLQCHTRYQTDRNSRKDDEGKTTRHIVMLTVRFWYLLYGKQVYRYLHACMHACRRRYTASPHRVCTAAMVLSSRKLLSRRYRHNSSYKLHHQTAVACDVWIPN